MRLAKSSLISLLMEEGEEDIAVLIARSSLPDDLDVDRDAEALAALGLAEEDLHAMLPSVSGGAAATGPRLTAGEMSLLEETISARWAHLVSDWTRDGSGR